MLNISQNNRDAIQNSNIENKDNFLFLSNHIVSCIKTNNKPNRLYNAFASTLSGKAPEKRPEISKIEGMKRHKGYTEYNSYLADSQRKALNNLNTMKSGDFFALSTDNLNSKLNTIKNMIYSSYITEALGDGPAPVIIYTGDDKSVDSLLQSIKELENNAQDNILYKHWLQNVSFTGTYINETYANSEHQHISKDGKGFIDHIDTPKKIEENKKLMIYNCYLIFNVSYPDLTSCKDALHTRLFQLDDTKNRILDLISELNNKGINFDMKKGIDALRTESETIISKIESNIERLSNRIKEWKEYFDNEPKGLSFLLKKKLKDRFNSFITEDEKALITESMLFSDIEKIYNDKIKQREDENKEVLNTEKLKITFFDLLNNLKKNGVNIENEITKIDLDEINRIMDSTVRYHELWYAIHYYECRWLMGEFSLKDTVKHDITKEAIDKRFHRLAMISPLLVSKFSDLPFNLFSYVSEDKPTFPVYDFIDILIIDNADNIPASIAASTFYLAKKAVVIGRSETDNDSLLTKAGCNGITMI